jgi:hypothetical protein
LKGRRIAFSCAALVSGTLLASPVGAVASPAGATASARAVLARSVPLPDNGALRTVTTPPCEAGTRATGGGFAATRPTDIGKFPSVEVRVLESRKIGQRTWRTSGFASTSGNPPSARLTAFVYCKPGAPATTQKLKTVTITADRFAVATARCGDAGNAQAGGFQTPRADASTFGVIFESFRAGSKDWRSRSVMNGAESSRPKLTSYAYCADRPALRTRLGAANTADFKSVTATTPGCPRGTAALAGGFGVPNALLGQRSYRSFWESHRAGAGWRTSAVHAGDAATLNTTAYCG